MKVTAVRRADRFSPNCIEKDRLILKAVLSKLRLQGAVTRMVDEADLEGEEGADVYLSMARSESALQWLERQEHAGRSVINSTMGVRQCQRSVLTRIMDNNGFCIPPKEGNDGYWIKRGDATAQRRDDVLYCKNKEALLQAQKSFEARGITDYVISAHIKGDLIKFYGVKGQYFRYFYPTDDGGSKFGNECMNGPAHHYPFEDKQLKDEMERLASLINVCIYGGDAIVDQQGRCYIIDFNDWPSFSRCREEAAKAIAQLTMEL